MIRPWQEEIKTGVREIDDIHQKMVDKIDQIMESCKPDRTFDNLSPLIDSLEEHIIDHFSSEEELMLRSNFPGYPPHKVAHEQIITDYRTIKMKAGEKATGPRRLGEMFRHFCGTLVVHLNHHDRALAFFIKSNATIPF